MYNERERTPLHPNEIARRERLRAEEEETEYYYTNDWPTVKAKLGKPYNKEANGELITQAELYNSFHNASPQDHNAVKRLYRKQQGWSENGVSTSENSNGNQTKISQPGDAVEQHAEQVTKHVIENKQTEPACFLFSILLLFSCSSINIEKKNNVDSVVKDTLIYSKKIYNYKTYDSLYLKLKGCCDTLAFYTWKNGKYEGRCFEWGVPRNDTVINPENPNDTFWGHFEMPNTILIFHYKSGVEKKYIRKIYSPDRKQLLSLDSIDYGKDTLAFTFGWRENGRLKAQYKTINSKRMDTAFFWHPNGNLSSMEVNNANYETLFIKEFAEDGETIIEEIYYDKNNNPIYRIKDGKKVD
jgi:hypothetical protein